MLGVEVEQVNQERGALSALSDGLLHP